MPDSGRVERPWVSPLRPRLARARTERAGEALVSSSCWELQHSPRVAVLCNDNLPVPSAADEQRGKELIVGVATAATLWFITVAGLCSGGGQIALGVASALIGLAVISGLRTAEEEMVQSRNVALTIQWREGAADERTFFNTIAAVGLRAAELDSRIREWRS